VAHFGTLTAREREVMALFTAGLMNKQNRGPKSELPDHCEDTPRANHRKMAAKSLADLVKMPRRSKYSARRRRSNLAEWSSHPLGPT